jgi:hypothetical protein
MKTLLIALFAFIVTASAQAQVGKAAFSKKVHDFGEIQEGTIATYTFEFVNEGKRPLRLINVIASCGCTTPEYSKTPVAAGQKGFIKVAYDSNGRPGIIDRAITVQTDGDPAYEILQIKGAVVNNKIKGGDLKQLGNLLFNAGTINAGSVATGSNFSKSVEYQVTGTSGVKILKVESATDIEVKHFQFTAQPQEIFQVTVYFKPTNKRRLGAFNEAITLVTDDPVMPKKIIYLTGVLTSSTSN